ncbi:MAG: DEAD/DEAH box helicase family protein [Prevotella sp.]|nr:DEAD/DEAH box helicase family protein [Prevotella sp.]
MSKDGIGDMLMCVDEATGEPIYVAVKDVKFAGTKDIEDYKSEFRTFLQQRNSEAYAAAAAEQGQEPGDEVNNEPIDNQDEKNSTSTYSLSDKKAGNGEPFYQDENGSIDLAQIPDEVFESIGYTKAPFRLTPSMIKHMLARHNKELGFKNETEAIHFVRDVMANFDHVRLGNDGALIFSIENERNRTGKRAVTILINSDNGEFYGLKTSGYEAIKGLEKRPLLWERGAKKESSSTDAASASVSTSKSSISGEQSGSASHQSIDLDSKDSNNSSNLQEKGDILTFKDGTPVPVDANGEPDFMAMSAEDGARFYRENYEEDAEKQLDSDIKDMEKVLKDAQNAKVKGKTQREKIASHKANKEAVALAQAQLDKANEIRKAMTASRIAESVKKPEATWQAGTEAMNEAVARFVNAPKVEGRRGSITLPNGEKIKGRYVAVPAMSLIPSHDPFNGYKPHEGAPLDEEGHTVNDRDYEHEKESQLYTEEMGRDYGGQALTDVPVVNPDGRVVSGNGRTMAGQLAARNGTDWKYVEARNENAEGFGMKAEDLDKLDHARIVFIPDEPLPYDTATFAKFNRNEKKTQSNTQQAVANSKKLSPEEVGAIVSEIEGAGTLDAFFNNPKAINSLVKTLIQKGVIGQNDVAVLMEANGERLSAQGKELVKNLLLGGIFKEETIRMMGIDGSLKTKALNGIRSVMENMKLGKYSLRDEIDNAIQLLYSAKRSRMNVDDFLRQDNAFEENAREKYSPVAQALAKALEGNASLFRDLMNEYNEVARSRNTGESDMFGENLSRDELIRQFLEASKVIKENDIKLYGNEERHQDGAGGNHAAGHEEPSEETGGGAGKKKPGEDVSNNKGTEEKISDPAEGLENAADKFKEEQKKRNGQEDVPETPAPQKPWSEMNGEERLAVAEKNPLTEEEIRTKTSEENKELIDDAIDYLNGNKGFVQQIAYLKIYDDVRNRHEAPADDSGAEDGTQLDAAGNEGGGELGLGTGGEGGGPSKPLDSGTDVPKKRGKGDTDDPAVSAGEQGHNQTGGETPGLDGMAAGNTGPEGSGGTGGKGGSAKRGRKGGNQQPAGENAGGKPASKQGTTWRGRTGDEIRQEAEDAKAALKNALKEMLKRGKGSASISLVGLNNEQIEYVPELMKAVKRYGMAIIDKGIYKMKDWISNIREGIHDGMKEIGFSDNDIDDFIKEMWNSKMTLDGESHTIAEWSAIYGKEQLRKALAMPLEEKRRKQQEAEKVAVKVGDRENIAETLPFLLPEQQEDVAKAETQFFDPKHADDEHGGGNGILFTNGTGTGKTYTGLGIAKRFIKQGKGRVLIVTPSQEKVTDWSNDAKNLGIRLTPLVQKDGKGATQDKGEGAVITTFANFRANRKLMEDVFDLVIYDESHKLMESKDAKETSTTTAHYRLTNKDFASAQDRVMLSHPLWIEEEKLRNESKRLMHGSESLEEARLNPKVSDAEMERLEEIETRLKAIAAEQEKAMPEIDRKARESVGKTKVVFLSATPFNMRENLDYVEGYLFRFKMRKTSENMSADEYAKARNQARNSFYRQNFPHGEAIGSNGKVQPAVTDADLLDKEERAFADRLMELGVMSGRTIDNGYDYSRDFPMVSVSHANEYNKALKEMMENTSFKPFAEDIFQNYNAMSVIYETMKVAAIRERLNEHLKRGRKIVVFHRRVNDRMGLAQPPFNSVIRRAEQQAKALFATGKSQDAAMAREIMDDVARFKKAHQGLLDWENSLDYRMPREQLRSLFGDAHEYTPAEMMMLNSRRHYIDEAFGSELPNGMTPYEAGKKYGEACFDPEDADVVKQYAPHEITDEEAEMTGDRKPSKKEFDALKVKYAKIAEEVRRGISDAIQEKVDKGEIEFEVDENGKRVRHVGLFAGADSKGKKHEDIVSFNSDDSPMNIIVVQEASGKEGISLHDTTGKHQRVMVNLALPQSPIAFIQAEGRIYRIGQKSNAIFEYPLLGIDNEIALFAGKFNGRAATTENLALGNMARGLKDAITRGVMTKSGKVPVDGQGFGGREFDLRADQRKTGYDAAVEDYRSGDHTGNKSIDDMDTLEPLGFKLVEFAEMKEGENTLEPSAGNGNVSRYIPNSIRSLSIEPDSNKSNHLMLLTGGVMRGTAEAQGRKTLVMNGKFEDLAPGNKFDTIVMNSPNGAEGEMAKAHLEKALVHLNDSGRLVAVLPETDSMDKFLDELVAGNTSLHLSGEVKLPGCAYVAGGVSQKAKVVVIDKLSRKEIRSSWKETERVDLSGCKDMEDFFSKLKDVKMPERVLDPAAKDMKHANKAKAELGKLKAFSARGGYLSVYEGGAGFSPTNDFLKSMGYIFKMKDRYGEWRYCRPIIESGYEYKEIKALSRLPLAQYHLLNEVLKMSDEDVADKIFGHANDKKKALYANDLKEYAKAVTKMIRGISGRTDDQLERAFNGEDIDNPIQMAAGTKLSMNDVRAVFEANNGGNEELAHLFNSVFDRARDLGLKVSVYDDENSRTAAFYRADNTLQINAHFWNAKEMYDAERNKNVKMTGAVRAAVLTHELIHSVTAYANYWYDHDPGRLSEGLREAARNLDELYKTIMLDERSYKLPSYCKENKDELVAEMADPETRVKLQHMGFWTRLVDAVKKFFTKPKVRAAVETGFARDEDFEQSSAYNELSKTLDKFLDSFDQNAYEAYVAIAGRHTEQHDSRFEPAREDKRYEDEEAETRIAEAGNDEFYKNPLRFQIKTPEQRKAAENAYGLAQEHRPDKYKSYAIVDMDSPNSTPEYFEKKSLGDFWRRYYNRLRWGNYKLFNLDKTFDENVNGLKGPFPDEFDTRPVDVKEREKAEKAAVEAQHREIVLRDEVVATLKNNGLDVSMNTEEGQRMIDEVNGRVRMSAKKRRALETASLGTSPRSLTVVSSANGAKILKNVETLATELDKSSTQPKTFIGDVAKAIGAERFGSGSEYATFETKNGQIVTIRLANHNAHVSGFDHNGRDNGISIVISPKPNEGISNDGKAHIVEFYYDSIKLRRADGKPLAEIVRSIEQALYSGEFKDTTGLAERQEVNADDIARFQKVYHGSGADFDHFDHSHMGEGEGAQVYGWGTYVTEVKGIGKAYAHTKDGNVQRSIQERQDFIKQRRRDIKQMEDYDKYARKIMKNRRESEREWKAAKKAGDEKDMEFYQSLMDIADSQLKPENHKALIESFWDDINNAQADIDRLQKSMEGTHHLYTVKIPDDNGSNYLDWNDRLSADAVNRVASELEKQGWKRKDENGLVRLERNGKEIVLNERATGADLYEEINVAFNSKQQASDLLSSAGFTGIKYPADNMRGGREDGKKNYVIFNEKDAKITDHVRFFRTANGEAYGFTVGGKIYIDPRIANSETPIHEYAHLWASALKRGNAKEWKNVVGLMKNSRIWNDVAKNYPELKDDDAIADEVIATYSGRIGAERLRKMAEEVPSGNAFEKAEAISTIAKVKQALDKFWKGVADMLHIHYTTAEEVADRVMKDLLDGVDPRKMGEADKTDTTSEVVETTLEAAEEAEKRISFHKETDEETLRRLEREPKEKVFRAMQVIDGKLYPPMAAAVDGKRVEANELGTWIRADENPDLAIPDMDPKTGKQKVDKKTGELKWKFKLDKGGKDATGKKATDIPAAYNPYWHTSRSPMNDQFKSAWIRPNIVTVECEVPASELSSGYKADRAKDAVGEVDWKSGSVSGEVFKQTGRARKVILSRWCKPVRVLPESEVAERIKEFIGDADVTIPENVVTPKLRVALEKAGMKIGAPEKGVKKSEQIAEALEKGLTIDNSVESSASPVDGMERATTMYREEQRARLQQKNSGKDGRIVPDDVEKSVSSQIEKKFDEEIEGIAKDVKDKGQFRKKLAEDVERISRTPRSELETELEELKNNQNEEIRREKSGGTEAVSERGEGDNKQYPWALQDRATAAAIERELDYRRVRAESIRATYGLQAGSEENFRKLAEGVEKSNIGKEIRSLSSKVSSVIKRLGVEINAKSEDKAHDSFGQSNTDRSVDYYIDKIVRTSSSPIEQPTTIVHELIHQGVDHAIDLVNSDKAEGVLTPKQIEAVNTILDIYQKAKIQPERFKENSYGLKNEYEFTAQMADPRQRKALELSVWDRVVNFAHELANKGDRSVWQTVKDSVKKLFEISDKDKMDKAIENVLGDFHEFAHDKAMDDVNENDWSYASKSSVTSAKSSHTSPHFRVLTAADDMDRPETESVVESHVQRLGDKLGVHVNMMWDVEDIPDSRVKADLEAGKKVAGWYDEKTGRVYLYMPNVRDTYTAEKTVWHEVVGHKGLRGLMGKEFNQFLRTLWNDLDSPVNKEMRAYVKSRMDKDALSFYDAIEEYLAESAEKGKGEPGFWNNIKNKFSDFSSLNLVGKTNVLYFCSCIYKINIYDESTTRRINSRHDGIRSGRRGAHSAFSQGAQLRCHHCQIGTSRR